MNDFIEALRGAGLIPGRVEPDGKWYRCRTDDKPKRKNGAYKLAADGRIGWFRNYATHDSTQVWRPEADAVSSAPVDFAAIRRREAEERTRRERAIQAARDFYERCSALVGGHDYLACKGLDMTGCRGLRVDRQGRLVVPMLRDGNLVSVQRIGAAGDKKFWPGAPTTAASYTLERQGATLTVLCEGLATGLAIYAAVAAARVVVAFNAGNMPKVAAQLPRRGMTCVAADNDHATAGRIGRNPGVDLATEAAAVLGCGVAVPERIEGTDFCDLRNERIAARLARPGRGRGESESAIRRAVDGEIAQLILRAARFLSVSA